MRKMTAVEKRLSLVVHVGTIAFVILTFVVEDGGNGVPKWILVAVFVPTFIALAILVALVQRKDV